MRRACGSGPHHDDGDAARLALGPGRWAAAVLPAGLPADLGPDGSALRKWERAAAAVGGESDGRRAAWW
jgi:hypothetical protein